MEIDTGKLGVIESLNEHCVRERSCESCYKSELCTRLCGGDVTPQQALDIIYSVIL